MELLVTGGAGFVGSNLAISFAKKGWKVTALDNLKRRGSELNVSRLREAGVEFTHGDIRNREDLEAAGKADVILECSAEPSVLAGYDSSPEYLLNTNLLGTINCLEHARKHRSHFVFLSTSRVYPVKTINMLNYVETPTRFELSESQPVAGASCRGIGEAFPLDGARTLYGATKLCSELLIREYVEMYGLKAIVDRCGLLTGSWQMGKVDQGVIVLWAAKHYYRQPLSYIGYGGCGKQVRDLLDVRDLFRLLEIQIDHIEQHSGQTYNVGGGLERSVSLCELTALCQRHTGNKVSINSISENRAGDIKAYITDNAKVTAMTGWKPEISVEQTIRDIVEWIKANADSLRPILS